VTRDDDLRREGMADAAVLLVARRVMPTMRLTDWARALGLTEVDVQHAVNRIKKRAATSKTKTGAPRKTAPHTCGPQTCPTCAHVCADRRGLAAHMRSHATTTCDTCGRQVILAGIGPHRKACRGAAA
jgi:hypothetical protein